MNEEYEILAETLEILDPTQREIFLTNRCGDDTKLFQKVNDLLEKTLDEETKFGKYLVEKEIGEGGMGKIYLASFTEEYKVSGSRKKFSKKVALKTVNPRQKLDSVNIRIFLNEIRTMSELNHPNIARFYDTGTSEKGLPFFTMEYVEGTLLSDYCKTNRLSVKERLALFSQVLNAFEYLHSKGLLHCDIKPQNVIVDNQGIPKVIDFGIASKYGAYISDENTQTAFMQTALTINYASPEQLKGEKKLTPSTDIYSLGVVLYELLTEQLPVKYSLGSSYFEMVKVLEGKNPMALSQVITQFATKKKSGAVKESLWRERNCQSLAELKAELSGELNEIVQTAISKKPKDRYESVKEFNRHIKEYLEVAETSFLENLKKSAALLSKKTVRQFKKTSLGLKIALPVVLLLAVGLLTQIRSIQILPYYFQSASTPLVASNYAPLVTDSISVIKSPLAESLEKSIAERESSAQKSIYNEWGMSQMIVALADADFKPDANRINLLFDGKDSENVCWQEEVSKPCNLSISGWVFLAKQRLGKKITDQQLDFVLERQSPEGWWSVFPALNEQRNAGVYATTLLIWGLSEHLKVNAISESKKEKTVTAIKKGVNWLLEVRKTNEEKNFQWADYPSQDKFNHFHGLDGVVIHTLHKIAKMPEFVEMDKLKTDLKAIDARWLLNLEQNALNLDFSFEQRSFSYVYTENGVVYDTTGHYSLPWGISATAEVYQNADAWQKAIIRKWMDNLIETSRLKSDKINEKYWVAAEYLYALRNLAGK
jgi:serine/threonine protein kinase